jgi:hypothetical protein
MERREVKLLSHPLVIELVFVFELHVLKDRTGDRDHKLRHREEGLAALLSSDGKALRVNLLRDPVEVPEDDATLGEAKYTIEGALVLEHIDQVSYNLFQACYEIRRRYLLILLG